MWAGEGPSGGPGQLVTGDLGRALDLDLHCPLSSTSSVHHSEQRWPESCRIYGISIADNFIHSLQQRVMPTDEDMGKARGAELLEVEDEEQRQARMRRCISSGRIVLADG